jgi:hypothetical protein
MLSSSGGKFLMEWYTEDRFKYPPLVTNCCACPGFFNVLKEDHSDAGVLCDQCNKYTSGFPVHYMTVEDYNKRFNSNITEEEFYKIYERPKTEEKL